MHQAPLTHFIHFFPCKYPIYFTKNITPGDHVPFTAFSLSCHHYITILLQDFFNVQNFFTSVYPIYYSVNNNGEYFIVPFYVYIPKRKYSFTPVGIHFVPSFKHSLYAMYHTCIKVVMVTIYVTANKTAKKPIYIHNSRVRQ